MRFHSADACGGCTCTCTTKAGKVGWRFPQKGRPFVIFAHWEDKAWVEVEQQKIDLVSGDGQRIPLTVDEAHACANDIPEVSDQVARLDSTEIRSADDSFAPLRAQVPDGLTVMLDTTTLHSAARAIYGFSTTPLAMLDLATFTTSVICFDNVLAQPPRLLDSEHAAGLGVTLLKQEREIIRGPLWSLCAETANHFRNHEQRRVQLEDAWAGFLGRRVRLDFSAWDRHQNSPYAWDGVVADSYAEDLLTSERKGYEEFVSVQTMRTLVNYELAGRLSVPYLAAAFRAPIQSVIIRENHARQIIIDRLMGEIGPIHAKQNDERETPYAREYSAPFLFALVLEKMNRPEDYWEVVAGYRERFRPLRERLGRDRDSWDGRVGPYVNRLLRSAGVIPKALVQSESAFIDAGAAAVAGALGGMFGAQASLAMKLVTLLSPAEHAFQCYRRWFRPELYLLTALRKEAELLRTLDNRVEAIWKTHWTSREYHDLDILCSTNPAPFLRLGAL